MPRCIEKFSDHGRVPSQSHAGHGTIGDFHCNCHRKAEHRINRKEHQHPTEIVRIAEGLLDDRPKEHQCQVSLL